MPSTLYNKLFSLVYYDSIGVIKKLLFYIPPELKLGGKHFRETYNFIKQTEFLPREKLLRLQEKMLKKILMYTVKNVPFYRKLRIKISSLDNAFEVIQKFPIVDKDFIQENRNNFISLYANSFNVYYTSTGGTSGKQFSFYVDKNAYSKEWAFMVNMWERAGYKLGDKIITFRGVKIKGVHRGIYWQEQPLYNALEMSPFHLNYETANIYIKKIVEWKPKFLHGYPSCITLLAKLVRIFNFESFPKIKAVFLASENIYPWQRNTIEKAFNTRVFSWYGMTEKTVLAGECEYSHIYHVFPQYSYVEVLDKNGEQVDKGEEGEVIATCFLSTAMPLIRYRTNDKAKISQLDACECKREYLLFENVKGHRNLEDLVVGRRGSLISLTALNIHSDAFDNCERFQLYQDTPGKLIIRIVPIRGKFSEKDVKKIESVFKNRISNELDIEIDLSENIFITPAGKVPILDQKLNIEKYINELIY